jgi:hypothetical protein
MVQLLNDNYKLIDKPTNLVCLDHSKVANILLQKLNLIKINCQHDLTLLASIEYSFYWNKGLWIHGLNSLPTLKHIKKSIFVRNFFFVNILDQEDLQTRSMDHLPAPLVYLKKQYQVLVLKMPLYPNHSTSADDPDRLSKSVSHRDFHITF